MSERIVFRFERNVIRIEAPDHHALSTILPNALADEDGFILRAGLDRDEIDELTSTLDPARHHVKVITPLAPFNVSLTAEFLHHVAFEFLYKLRNREDATIGWSMGERCDIALEFRDFRLSTSELDGIATELRKYPLVQSLEIDGIRQFDKGRANHPLVRAGVIAGGVVAVAALIVVPLFAIDAALDRHPAWRNAFLIALAVAATAAALAFVVYEVRRERVRPGRLVLTAAIMLLVLVQLFQAITAG